jgi:protein-tyrosine-phosphatase
VRAVPRADVVRRAERHAALADPIRLSIVDDLTRSDRAPSELAARFGLADNLLAHHLSVLERSGLVSRVVSEGDRRRRYVRLVPDACADLGPRPRPAPSRILFVCTHNSARSQLAAALWRRRLGGDAESAGTHPAARVHPGAVAAARRAGLDLSRARPRTMPAVGDRLVVTVCDRAHEELGAPTRWWHWSIADPISEPHPDAFDAVIEELDRRIRPIGLLEHAR